MITASSETIDNAPTSNLTADVIAYFIEEELKEYFGIENNENNQTVFTKAPIITDSSRVKVSYGEDMTQQDVVYVEGIIPFDTSNPIPYTLTEYPPYEYSMEVREPEINTATFSVATLSTPLFNIMQLKMQRSMDDVAVAEASLKAKSKAIYAPITVSQTINSGDRTYKRQFAYNEIDPEKKRPYILRDTSTSSNLTHEALSIDAQTFDGNQTTSVYSDGMHAESYTDFDDGITHTARYESSIMEIRRYPSDSDETMVYVNAVDGLQTYNFTTQEATGLNNKKLMVHDVVNNKQAEVSTDGLVVENRGGENTKCSVGSGQIRMSDYAEGLTSSHTTITKTSIDMNYGTAGAGTTGILLNKDTGITVRNAEVDNLVLTSSITGDGVLVANHSTKGTSYINTSRVGLTDVNSNNDITKQTTLTTSGLTVIDNTASPALEVSLDATKINALLDIITAWNNTSSGSSLVKP